jgi:hypothetical protein
MNGGLIKSCELVARVRSGRVVKAGSNGVVMYNTEWFEQHRDTELRGCGVWEHIKRPEDTYGMYRCSICHHLVQRCSYNFCPHCGAKMSKEANE